MLWFKTFHLLFVIAWMAGLFYLPRILVHYREGLDAGEDVRRLAVMAAKLNRFSAMMGLLAFGFGAVLWLYYGLSGPWLYLKLLFVAGLAAYQALTWQYAKRMARAQALPSSRFFRFYNEAALLLLIPILLLAVFKPYFL